MQIEKTPTSEALSPTPARRPGRHLSGSPAALQAHQSLARIFRLLQNVNVRLSLFLFDPRRRAPRSAGLYETVREAVDDCGLAFELDDGRIGAVVYGWRPPRAADGWVETRTLGRLETALGGPGAVAALLTISTLHRWSSEVSCAAEIPDLLTLARPLRAAVPAGTA